MKKACGAIVVCAMAIGLVAAPNGIAKKGPNALKRVPSSVSVIASNTVPATLAGVYVEGRVSSKRDACRKGRQVGFSWVNQSTGAVQPLPKYGGGGPHGNYNAVLPRPTATTLPATFVLVVTTPRLNRQVRQKKGSRGRKYNCLEATGNTAVTFLAP